MPPKAAAAPCPAPPSGPGAAERAGWSAAQRLATYAGSWNLGFQVRDLHRIFRAHAAVGMQRLGLPVGYWSYLWALYEEDGLVQAELARRVRLMGPSTVVAVNGLERHGLVERRPNAEDRRTVNVFLTSKGRAIRKDILHVAAQYNATALRHLSNAEVETLFELLGKVRGGLGDDPPAP